VKTLMQTVAMLLALGIAVAGATPVSAQQSTAARDKGKYQIVFHVTEGNPQQWNLTLNNAMAFQRNLGKENTEIEIVANGPGLNMLKTESKVADRISQALDKNIDVVACGETMETTKVTKADLVGGVRVVKGGIIEIADRQRAGWVYIRP
jgi:intracellular sulfur oxidation DsrE/DsrF family protein